MKKLIASGATILAASAISIGSFASVAHAAEVAPVLQEVNQTGSPDSAFTASRNARIARQFTKVTSSSVDFDRAKAISAGMTEEFAEVYGSLLNTLQEQAKNMENPSFVLTITDGQAQIRTSAEGIPEAATVVTPRGGTASDPGSNATPSVSFGCVMAQLGVGIATVALMASIFATGGAMALAAAGYTTAAISIFTSCNK